MGVQIDGDSAHLFDANGRVVAAFPSRVKPDAPEVLKAIEQVL